MSNDNSRKRLKAPWQSAQEAAERKARLEEGLTVYVQSSHQAYTEDQVLRIIKAAKGTIIETIPFKNSSRAQYKISITREHCNALSDEGAPVILVSKHKPFRKPENWGIHAFLPSKDCL